ILNYPLRQPEKFYNSAMRLTYFHINNSKFKISILVKLINKFRGDFKETFTILNNYTPSF
ncbi:MAG: hypothetical protein ACYT04_98145, partial [Nostoc sp.]